MRVGYHVNKQEHSLARAVRTARDYIHGLDMLPAAQIFVHGPRTHDETVSAVEIEEIRDIRDVGLVIHGAYPDYPWKNNPEAISGIRRELQIADEMGASGVVIHLGAEAATRETLLRVLSRIDEGLNLTTTRTLWLETNVTLPEKATFSDPAGLRALMVMVKSRKYANINVGLCLDTAHLHSCGVKLQTTREVTEFLNGLPSAKYMLHLNDSAMERGSGKDKHAALGRGKIWEETQAGLVVFVEWAARMGVTVILERHPDDLSHDLGILNRILT
jgi:deoxyribonuclease IV